MTLGPQSNFVYQGKALALTIKGLVAIGETSDGFGIVETKVRAQLIRLYQRELKQLLQQVSNEDFNEILAIVGPKEGPITIDPSLN